MDELNKQIIERTGLDSSMAETVGEVVAGFSKDGPGKVSGLMDHDEGIARSANGIFIRD